MEYIRTTKSMHANAFLMVLSKVSYCFLYHSQLLFNDHFFVSEGGIQFFVFNSRFGEQARMLQGTRYILYCMVLNINQIF